jgi:hypothetical protein
MSATQGTTTTLGPNTGKRTILRVEEVRMADLKKGDRFLMVEDGAFLHDGRVFVADANGEEVNDVGSVEAHII